MLVSKWLKILIILNHLNTWFNYKVGLGCYILGLIYWMFMGLISWVWFGEEHEAWSSCPGEEEEQCSSEK